jgi:peptidoglycan-associated lipoprotein
LSAILLVAACASSEDEMTDATAGGGGQGVPGSGAGGGMSSEGGISSYPTSSSTSPGYGAGQRSMRGSELQQEMVRVGDRVFFAFDDYNLDTEARATLDRQAALLRSQGAITVVIEGHCDERGTREYNLALGERRANSAKDYLVALGITSNRIRTVSYGKDRPVVVGSGEDIWSQNRVAITVVSGAAAGS